jgi:copper(I)-binding protein
MKPIAIAVLAAAVSLAGASAAGAHEVKAGDLTLKGVVVRASLGANPNTAAYLTIVNAGPTPDRLLSVSCACAASVSAHLSQMHGGMMSMAPAGPVVVPAHGAVSFAPGGLHLMVMGLKAPLQDGAMQEMTLRFQRAGVVKAGFHVQAKIEAR